MSELREIPGQDADGYGRYSTGILPSHILKRLIAAGRDPQTPVAVLPHAVPATSVTPPNTITRNIRS